MVKIAHYEDVKKFMNGLQQILKKEAIANTNGGKVFFSDLELWAITEFGFSKAILMRNLLLLEETGKVSLNKIDGYVMWIMEAQ